MHIEVIQDHVTWEKMEIVSVAHFQPIFPEFKY